MISEWILLAVFTLVVQAIGNIPIGKMSEKYGSKISSLIAIGGGIPPLLIGVYLFNAWSISAYSLILCLVCGVFSALGYLFFYKALETKYLSESAGLFAIQPAILFLFGIFGLNEAITLIEVIGTVLVFIGIGLITIQKWRVSRAFAYGILGNLSWAIYWILFAYAITNVNQPILQLAITRVVGTLVVLVPVMLAGKIGTKVKKDEKLAVFGFAGGILNGISVVTFALLIVINYLALGSIITSLGPALLALFAYLIFREKPRRMQIIGLAVAVAGAFLISL